MLHIILTALLLIFVAAGCGLWTDVWFFAIGDPQERTVARGRIGSWLGKYLLDKFDAEEAAKPADPDHYPVHWSKLLVCPWCSCVWFTAFACSITLILLHADWTAWLSLPLLVGWASVCLSASHRLRMGA